MKTIFAGKNSGQKCSHYSLRKFINALAASLVCFLPSGDFAGFVPPRIFSELGGFFLAALRQYCVCERSGNWPIRLAFHAGVALACTGTSRIPLPSKWRSGPPITSPQKSK